MAYLSVAFIKNNRAHQSARSVPREGTKLRELWDRLHAGEAVHCTEYRQEYIYRILPNDYGLELRNAKGGFWFLK